MNRQQQNPNSLKTVGNIFLFFFYNSIKCELCVLVMSKGWVWAGGIAQWVKALTTKPDALNLSLQAHMVEKRTDLPKLSSDLHTCYGTH